jgi:hypothetical protein
MSHDASKFCVLNFQQGDQPITEVLNWLAQARK